MNMIKELTKRELENFTPLMEKDRDLNLFFLNNHELFVYGKDYTVYQTKGLLIMCSKHGSMVLFSYGEYDTEEVSIFINDKKPIAINGPKNALSPLEGKLQGEWKISYPSMMAVTRECFKKCRSRSDNLSLLLTFEDFYEVAELYSKDEEFKDGFETEEKREEWAYDKEEGMEYPHAACGYRVKKRLVGVAYLASATKESAMVVGVLVDKDWRGGGIGTEVIQEITDIGLNDHLIKRLCLFPSGEVSKHIYSKLGYKEVGEYAFFQNLSLKRK